MSLLISEYSQEEEEETDSKFDETLVRMVSNKDNRSDVDWELFVATWSQEVV